MNVNDILQFKAQTHGKRFTRDTEDRELGALPFTKSRKLANGDTPSSNGALPPGFFDGETEEIMKKIQSSADGEPFNETALRKLINSFDRKVFKNQEQRVKYSDDPTKFMDSEIELNDAIQELHIIATQPDLYAILLQMNTLHTLIQLLSHENTDISIAVVDLLQELTDVDTLTDGDQDAAKLVDALAVQLVRDQLDTVFLTGMERGRSDRKSSIEQQGVASLLQNMERLDESVKEESDGIHNTLGVLENILEFKTESTDTIAKQGLLRWLLKRLKVKSFDANRLYASEILSILLQASKENRKLVGELDGIDVLLHQLATYKRHDPPSGEEYEMMENLFNCLCSALLHPGNRKLFLDGEGLQLMNLMLREKKQSRNSAVKVLDFALSTDEGMDMCNKFIDFLGLRTIFPLFMKPPKQHKKRGLTQEEAEEHLCSIVASLARNAKSEARDRFMSKFLENNLEKVERLMELHFEYADKVKQTEVQIATEKKVLTAASKEIDEDTLDEFDLRRLENGLFTLQRIDIVILEVYDDADAEVRKRVDRIFSMRGAHRSSVVTVIKEYLKEISEDKGDPSKQRDLKRLTLLIQRFIDSPTQ